MLEWITTLYHPDNNKATGVKDLVFVIVVTSVVTALSVSASLPNIDLFH